MILFPKNIKELPPIFHKIDRITVDECETVHIFSLAHTHYCPLDYWSRGTVCLKKESYLLNSDGTPSDIMWHELGHVLDLSNYRVIGKCITPFSPRHNNQWHDIIFNAKSFFKFEIKSYTDNTDWSNFNDIILSYRDSLPAVVDDMHGPTWQTIMKDLGKAHLISKYSRPPY